MNPDEINFDKLGGIVPAVVVDNKDGAVLMLGFMNREALDATLKSRRVTFWSRTKNRIWEKGETSGNTLDVVSVSDDCDGDTLLIYASPRGPSCHTGERTCFDAPETQGLQFLQVLYDLIKERQREMPPNSYTTALFKGGLEGILAKVQEESGEVLQAARKETQSRLAEESADLLYHLLVLLADQEVSLQDVTGVLANRNRKP